VSEDVWSEQDTTPDAIEAALRGLLRERYKADRSLAPARVLNLIVVADRAWKGEIRNRLERVGRYQASRTILCSVDEGRRTLDARAVMSYDPSPGGSLNVMHEQVEIDLGPEHLPRLDTIVDPVLVSELTTMLWTPHGHDEAVTALLPMIDVILLDSDDDEHASAALARAAELQGSVYVVDLAWLRTTPWRERLAAAFDPPERRAALGSIRELSVRHRGDCAASALLLASWLGSRLGWKVGALSASKNGELAADASYDGSHLKIALASVEQDAPGLAGVTVGWAERCELSLDRARGGLGARQRCDDGTELTWQVLGASRGEGGILGEGVRQALLRDATYSSALTVARTFCR
jgi:glucose-6-phosphate dehydrogenase assembly protein OpcA